MEESTSVWRRPAIKVSHGATLLAESVDSSLKIVFSEGCAGGRLHPGIIGILIDGRDDRHVVGAAFRVGSVVGRKGRDGKQHVGIESVHPGESDVAVGLALGFAQSVAVKVLISD